MIALLKKNPFKSRPGGTLLGLAFDGARLEGVVVRRTNGSVEITARFEVSLSLDLLTNAPELVGREIRKQLDAAGIRERWCAVCLPLSWALTLSVKLPDLPEADVQSFLQIEAERGFPYNPDALLLARSAFRTPGGDSCATLVAVPRDHLARLEAVLHAAQLRPVSFSLALPALQPAASPASEGVLALLPGETSVGMQITGGGGIVILRTVEGAFEPEGNEARIQASQVAREVRITLGQLSDELRESVRRVRVFGRTEVAEMLADQLRSRLAALEVQVERIRDYPSGEFNVRIPPGTPVSAAFSLAVQQLTGRTSTVQLLPPKVSAWGQFTARHASRKLVWAGTAAAAVIALVALVFGFQQWQILRWQSRWDAMSARVNDLETIQQHIRRYRPWFDESFRSLSVLRQLTQAFPVDGSVSAKTVEIRELPDGRELPKVTCSGTARNNQALLQTIDKLSAAPAIKDVQIEQIRGKTPLEFTLNFHWGQNTSP
jgi:hypothetical protein